MAPSSASKVVGSFIFTPYFYFLFYLLPVIPTGVLILAPLGRPGDAMDR